MNYFNLVFIAAFVAFAFFVARTVSRANRSDKQSRKEFFERESEANAVRKADISDLPYVKVPLDTLPLSALAEFGLANEELRLRTLSEQQILNLSMYTNTDLKMLYGPANLDTLSACDDAFTDLIRILDAIGVSLAGQGQSEAASAFLSYAVSVGSDITSTYKTLAALYADAGDLSALDRLTKQAEALTSLSRSVILNNLHSIKSQSKLQP